MGRDTGQDPAMTLVAAGVDELVDAGKGPRRPADRIGLSYVVDNQAAVALPPAVPAHRVTSHARIAAMSVRHGLCSVLVLSYVNRGDLGAKARGGRSAEVGVQGICVRLQQAILKMWPVPIETGPSDLGGQRAAHG